MSALLIETSLWIDFVRPRSPVVLKEFIAQYLLNAAAHVAEPIIFEVMRHATKAEGGPLKKQFETYPVLPIPTSLWSDAAFLGQTCRENGFTAGSLDLLISAIAIHHDAELVTFDDDYLEIARVSDLNVIVLRRP